MQVIPYQAMLEELSSTDQPFSITFCTCDVRRKTGGELVTLPRVINPAVKPAHLVSYRPPSTTKAQPDVAKDTRTPNHSEHGTRNLKNLANGHVVKVHTDLIVEFNGRIVIR